MESLSVPRPHPGTFVREKVIPSGMTVKEAAKRLGIGRQALSNFFLLIRDTPSEEVYVLNMFRMRGSRL